MEGSAYLFNGLTLLSGLDVNMIIHFVFYAGLLAASVKMSLSGFVSLRETLETTTKNREYSNSEMLSIYKKGVLNAMVEISDSVDSRYSTFEVLKFRHINMDKSFYNVLIFAAPLMFLCAEVAQHNLSIPLIFLLIIKAIVTADGYRSYDAFSSGIEAGLDAEAAMEKSVSFPDQFRKRKFNMFVEVWVYNCADFLLYFGAMHYF